MASTVPDEVGPATLRDLPPEEPPPLTLDFDGAGDPGFQPTQDLPPPPANVLGARAAETGTGRYRTVEERERAPLSSRRAKSERPPRTDKTPQPARKSERPMARSDRPAARKSDRPRESVRGAVREERGKRVNDPRAEPPSEPKQPIAGQSARPGPHAGGARPAAAFGQARPQQSSIFGEDIISDKSLDEVILSYLAEDLEEGSK